MFDEPVLFIFALIAINNTIHFGAYIMGANIYDAKQMRNRRQAPSEDKEQEPLVTVIVPAHFKEIPYGTFCSILRQSHLTEEDFR